jgi:hypothetical protein
MVGGLTTDITWRRKKTFTAAIFRGHWREQQSGSVRDSRLTHQLAGGDGIVHSAVKTKQQRSEMVALI